MAESSGKSEPESWEDIKHILGKLISPDVTPEVMTDIYNKWAHHGYDETLQEAADNQDYGGMTVAQQTMQDLFPTGRDTAVVLDVGAGTGISGKMLRNVGFKLVDGLDPAEEMLRVAQEKQIYRKVYTCYLTGKPTEIPAGSYDAVILVGVLGHGCVPCAAFEEMTRIVKPGGYIVNVMRRAYIHEVAEYRDNWEPLLGRMEKCGKWRVVKNDPFPSHFRGHEGLLTVFRVLV